jgi:hypothetical protein
MSQELARAFYEASEELRNLAKLAETVPELNLEKYRVPEVSFSLSIDGIHPDLISENGDEEDDVVFFWDKAIKGLIVVGSLVGGALAGALADDEECTSKTVTTETTTTGPDGTITTTKRTETETTCK